MYHTIIPSSNRICKGCTMVHPFLCMYRCIGKKDHIQGVLKKDTILIINNCFRFQDINFEPFEKVGFQYFI